MSDAIYPLATTTWDEDEFAAIQDVIASGMFTMGRYVQEFESKFAESVGSRYCVMVNSGSSANLLMIAAMRYRHDGMPLIPGDEVIVPAVSWSTTYYPVYQYGLNLRFVDVDRETLNFDLVALEAAITPRTKAILAVNLLGNPNDFSRIRNIIGSREIILLEDNCESLGASFENKHCGTYGLMGTYSAFFSHHISTMEGGMVVTDDEELYHILLTLRAHGWTRNLPQTNRLCRKSDYAFEESFRFILPGYNLRPLEISGAIGLQQLKKLSSMIEQRRQNALSFQQMINEFPWIRSQREIGNSSWFGFSLILNKDAHISRRELAVVLQEGGIDCRPIVAGNFAKNEQVLKWMLYSIAGPLTNAEEIDKQGLFVGNHHYRLDQELVALKSILREVQG